MRLKLYGTDLTEKDIPTPNLSEPDVSDYISWSILLFPLFFWFWKRQFFFIPSHFFTYDPVALYTI